MQIKYRLLSLLAFAALAVCGVGGASAQGWHLSAVLVGGHETPAAGHPTAYGTAAVTFRGVNYTQGLRDVRGHGTSSTDRGPHASGIWSASWPDCCDAGDADNGRSRLLLEMRRDSGRTLYGNKSEPDEILHKRAYRCTSGRRNPRATLQLRSRWWLSGRE